MDLNPEATGRASGAPAPAASTTTCGNPKWAAIVRWGFRTSLHGADQAGLFAIESERATRLRPRQARSFPENAVLLEGRELSGASGLLSARIVQPGRGGHAHGDDLRAGNIAMYGGGPAVASESGTANPFHASDAPTPA